MLSVSRRRVSRFPLIRAMLRRFRPFVIAAALIVSTSAASSAEAFDVRYLLATLGLFSIYVAARYIWTRDRGLLAFEGDVATALWGPRDANGKRNVEVGIVAIANRLAVDLPRSIAAAEDAARSAREAATAAQDAATYAATAASAAHTAQALLNPDRRRAD